jgi:hypothetical protein
MVVRHRLAGDDVSEVWGPGHRSSAEAAALASNRSRHLHVITAPAEPAEPAAGCLDLGEGDYDIAAPGLTVYEGGRS